jgi:hypothetical protein
MFFYYIHMYVLGKFNSAYMYTRREGWDSINRFNPALFALQTRTCISNHVGGLSYVQ